MRFKCLLHRTARIEGKSREYVSTVGLGKGKGWSLVEINAEFITVFWNLNLKFLTVFLNCFSKMLRTNHFDFKLTNLNFKGFYLKI